MMWKNVLLISLLSVLLTQVSSACLDCASGKTNGLGCKGSKCGQSQSQQSSSQQNSNQQVTSQSINVGSSVIGPEIPQYDKPSSENNHQVDQVLCQTAECMQTQSQQSKGQQNIKHKLSQMQSSINQQLQDQQNDQHFDNLKIDMIPQDITSQHIPMGPGPVIVSTEKPVPVTIKPAQPEMPFKTPSTPISNCVPTRAEQFKLYPLINQVVVQVPQLSFAKPYKYSVVSFSYKYSYQFTVRFSAKVCYKFALAPRGSYHHQWHRSTWSMSNMQTVHCPQPYQPSPSMCQW